MGTEEAINKLRETEEMLGKKSEFIEKQINGELQKAKQYGTKNKRQALQHLKKKKRLEQQLEQVDNTLTTIEFQRDALMSAKSNAEVLNTMKTAAGAMKKIHKENVIADIQEQQDIGAEIADAISRPIDIQGLDMDEDDLLAELDELEQEELDAAMISNPTPVNTLPAVPSAIPTSSTSIQQPAAQANDNDLADLENWMAS